MNKKAIIGIIVVIIALILGGTFYYFNNIANKKIARTGEQSRSNTDLTTNTGATTGNAKRVASEGAEMQTDDPSMPTRVLKEGTRINMHFGDKVIPGILNDSKTAQAFIEKLPLTVHESRYSHDFCGSMGEFLPFDEEDESYYNKNKKESRW